MLQTLPSFANLSCPLKDIHYCYLFFTYAPPSYRLGNACAAGIVQHFIDVWAGDSCPVQTVKYYTQTT